MVKALIALAVLSAGCALQPDDNPCYSNPSLCRPSKPCEKGTEWKWDGREWKCKAEGK
jgi:hypothetical protein